MNDHDALLAAIIADPADDLARLAFADWLEENGQDERAEFIRLGLELTATGIDYCPTLNQSMIGGRPNRSIRCGRCEFCKPMARLGELAHRGYGADLR